MALSSLTFTASRGRGPYSIHALDYLSTAHLSVTVNGVGAAATFDDARKEMTLAADPASGATIVVTRSTPRRQEDRLTQFLTLPSGQAGLTASLMDQDARQGLLLMGEGRDAADALTVSTGMKAGASGHWAGEARRIENLLAGASPGDAIIKSQLDTVDTTVRNLPTAVLDENDGLFVVGGEWDDHAPSPARTSLQLGSAAVLNAGVGANNIPQLDSSARYPAASGELIDLGAHPEILKRARATVVKTTRTVQPAPNLDPLSATWSQNDTSRFNFSGTHWANRVELNNSGDVDGSFTPGRFDLSAGTWRVRWFLKVRQTAAAGINLGFRITNNDNTSSQVIHVDYGVHRIIRQHNAGQTYFAIFGDELVIASASLFSLVFRWAMFISGGNNDADLGVFFHKVSTSSALA